MSDVKRLLDEATSLPWRVWDAPRPGIESDVANESIVLYGGETESDFDGVNTPENAALIVYAVNHLPAYEAAVSALDYLTTIVELSQEEGIDEEVIDQDTWDAAFKCAHGALADLQRIGEPA